jgi:hypothetical protein
VAQETELAAHLRAYENASVKYVLAPRSMTLSPALTAVHVTPVWHDALATIYELPHPRAFFTSSCAVTSPNVDAANVTCPTSSTLLRTELSMPGWTATVNGTPVTIHTVDGVYQSITVPRGTSRVHYSFVPPHEDPALALALLAVLFLVGVGLYERRRHPNPTSFAWLSSATPSRTEDF